MNHKLEQRFIDKAVQIRKDFLKSVKVAMERQEVVQVYLNELNQLKDSLDEVKDTDDFINKIKAVENKIRIVENEMIPNFRENRFYAGIDQATTILMKLASGEFPPGYNKNTKSKTYK